MLYLLPRRAIVNIDFWYHVNLGMQLSLGELESLVNGLYPLGYPFLLATAARQGFDVLRMGQALACLGGGIAIVAFYLWGCAYAGQFSGEPSEQLLARTSEQDSKLSFLTLPSIKSSGIAFLGCILLLANENFMIFATQEGNDMLSAGLQLLALTILLLAYPLSTKNPDTSKTPSYQWALLVGIILGLAYLVRYTALILAPIFLLYFVMRQFPNSRRLANEILWFGGGFLCVTAIQWIPSLLITGQPFFNTQAQNVWFGIYGQSDWVGNWDDVPPDINLLQIVALDPVTFLAHWGRQLQTVITQQVLWPLPLQIAWLVAVPLFAVDARISRSHRFLLLGTLGATIGLTALAWLDKRFMLVPLWLQAALILYLAYRISVIVGAALPRVALVRWAQIKVWVMGIVLLLCVSLLFRSWLLWWQAEPPTQPLEVNQFLRLAGMDDPTQVWTNEPTLHATDLPERTRYQQLYDMLPVVEDIDLLVGHLVEQNARYLLLDYATGLGDYTAVRDELTAADGLIPLSIEDERLIFCVRPCLAANQVVEQPANYTFGPLLLDGYRLFQNGSQFGLYLHWTLDDSTERSYKVSIRTQLPDGTQVSQVDGIPQQWTSPTHEWRAEQPVVDFYHWSVDNGCHRKSSCEVRLLVYDEATSEPFDALDEDGANMGPLVPLSIMPSSHAAIPPN